MDDNQNFGIFCFVVAGLIILYAAFGLLTVIVLATLFHLALRRYEMTRMRSAASAIGPDTAPPK